MLYRVELDSVAAPEEPVHDAPVEEVPVASNLTTPAQMKWGIDHEDQAIQTFITLTNPYHDSVNVTKCGFVINSSHPEVGASPDSLTECK